MIDVHPPHEAVHTWRDFFIHIATICIGLLIAIALEQAVEAIHHHHQRDSLEQQMLTESKRNLDLIQPEIHFAAARTHYLDECLKALQVAKPSAGSLLVTLPANDAAPPDGMLISPSQGTWEVARAAGTVALLPPDQAKVYARLNLAADFEQAAETSTGQSAMLLTSALLRDHLPANTTTPIQITSAQRDDLLSAFSQAREATSLLKFRLVVLEGALDAVLARVDTLEEMYPYQERAIAREGAHAPHDRALHPQDETPARP